MTNGFAMHGIDHLSASQINTFCAAPALWIMERLCGLRAGGGVGPAAHRGTAAEAGIEVGLFDQTAPVEQCVAVALSKFDALTAFKAGEAATKERRLIPGMVEIGLSELRQYGVPTKPEDGRQHRIEVQLDGVPVPFFGFLDFLYDDHGIVVDLKTSGRLPSMISEAHARQGALYAKAKGNHEIRFAYVTDKKVGVYRLEDVASHLAAVAQIAMRMERLLRLSKDPHEIAGVIVPCYDSFYWNDPAVREAGRQLYGF
jgi:hypothetical protein